jgi:hypothetical protein
MSSGSFWSLPTLIDYGAILVGNMHDINSKSHRDAVRELLVMEKPSIMCL